jgi:hypothetical protein
LTNDVIVSTIHTSPIPDMEALARRLERLRAACVRHGRSIDDLEIGIGGALPMLDVRRMTTDVAAERGSYDPDEQRRRIIELEALGVDWVFVTCCGDDPQVAIESVREFGDRMRAE